MQQGKKAIILLGPPGAGKGTIAALCAEEFGWKHLATGNLCREHMQAGTKLGLQMKSLIDAGQLVPDDIIMAMTESWFEEHGQGISGVLLDGIPRSGAQATFIQEMLSEKFPEFEQIIIQLDVDEEIVLERILQRVICENKSCQAVYSLKFLSGDNSEKMICKKCSNMLIKRSDDTQEAMKKRLNDYYQYVKDVLDYYKGHHDVIHTIDARQSIAELFENIKKIAYS